jgi:hypothetical protein
MTNEPSSSAPEEHGTLSVIVSSLNESGEPVEKHAGALAVRRSPWLSAALLAACQLPLQVGPSTLPDARVGEPYRAEIVVDRANTPIAAIAVSEGELPPGLQILFERHEETPPTLAGVPTRAGTYRFRVDVSCFGTNFPGQKGAETMTLVVHDVPPSD